MLQAVYAGEKRQKGEQENRKRSVLKQGQEWVGSAERAEREKSAARKIGDVGRRLLVATTLRTGSDGAQEKSGHAGVCPWKSVSKESLVNHFLRMSSQHPTPDIICLQKMSWRHLSHIYLHVR